MVAKTKIKPNIIGESMIKKNMLDSQVGFYYGTKIGDDKSTYNIAEYVEINHTLDIARMKRAIHHVISQTPTLHVLFDEDNGTPYQYPVTANISVEWVDLSPRANNMATAIELMEADARRPYSLNAAPLFRQKSSGWVSNAFCGISAATICCLMVMALTC